MGLPVVVELDDAVALGIGDEIGEHRAARGARHGPLKHRGQAGAVEDVVAENEGATAPADELAADDEGLRQAFGLRLCGIGEAHADAAAVAEQAHEAVLILRRGHEQNLADAGEHQNREGIVDQRLVVDRHQLLAGGDGGWIEARARTASEDDASHALSLLPSSRSIVALRLARSGRGLMPKLRSSFAVESTE